MDIDIVKNERLGSIVERILRHPRVLFFGLVLATVLALPALRRLELEGDLVDMLSRSFQAAQTFTRFTRDLGVGQQATYRIGADTLTYLRDPLLLLLNDRDRCAFSFCSRKKMSSKTTQKTTRSGAPGRA